ncbi:NAD(P)/FAD-dependent oxidoreductase [Psychrosphaera sp. B3R10]|uniref:NAD(P)/FAD-dependent oxidoreductase n=1 Tax=unclassified Psychrosphaera TaxID=2641570 RepID=UPI001C092FC9|nr:MULTISPECIES: NAD(P)/FAD-dependent oxidoreductase [unclassified Psychrosphaera]MBU2883656.1 NAD(P)/FAD-dependent oxidoreductase [Psychrosphaera sp. I2R16]MBU2991006.1 NAD(P)/FAD-dependent oxidoreductase [Psychrosphaera sp. B3R10]
MAGQQFDVIVIGAGAAGLMCAAQAGYRGRRVLLLDHAKQAGKKILISGGGRCNFTNMDVEPSNYLCSNEHFVKSALSRYTQWDFLSLIAKYEIAYHERDFGQLFCDDSAKDIVRLLMGECNEAGVKVQLRSEITNVTKTNSGFEVQTSGLNYQCESVVIATGGLSMPKLGATPFGYKVAEQFGLTVLPTRAGLVPFTLHDHDKAIYADLSGVSLPIRVESKDGTSFPADMLFTHRGLSGPSILQISNYWLPGEAVSIDLLPHIDLKQELDNLKQQSSNQSLKNTLAQWLPKRFIEALIESKQLVDKPIKQLQHKDLDNTIATIHQWQVKPNGTEGYRTAEGDEHYKLNCLLYLNYLFSIGYDDFKINSKDSTLRHSLLIDSAPQNLQNYKEAA